MPYNVVHRKSNPRGRRYCLVHKDGTTKSCHASRKLANKVIGIIHASEHGWTPSKKKR